MNVLTLQWHDVGQSKTQKIYEQQPSKNPGSVRIGRDPLRCDIIVSDPTVSGLHVEIFFDSQQQSFYIRNLRGQPNPPLVDGKQLMQGETRLGEGSIIYLGKLKFQVTEVNTNTIPATILTPPVTPQQAEQYQRSTSPTQPKAVYGLQCPKCNKVSPPVNLQVGCPWCGTSLAAAVSVLCVPQKQRE